MADTWLLSGATLCHLTQAGWMDVVPADQDTTYQNAMFAILVGNCG